MNRLRYFSLALITILIFSMMSAQQHELTEPIVDDQLVFEEENGVLAVEAEHFYKQSKTDIRAWYITAKGKTADVGRDDDGPHLRNASNNAYIEVLPDTRASHADELTRGENFSNEAGRMCFVHYKTFFNNPGRYYVWVRAYSSGTEDNGVHVGIDGSWPESGQRLQWCKGKNSWRWESKQRTGEVHCGVPWKIFLDIEEAGEHEIMFSMREDGFEFDKFIMVNDTAYKPWGTKGPDVKVKTGTLPDEFPVVEKEPDGNGNVEISGELKQWHKVTLTLDGPYAHELNDSPNPFRDYNMTVTFIHESGKPIYEVPGYFAADGNAANTGADNGTKWRAHLSPDKTGKWNYYISFKKGKMAAVIDAPWATKVAAYHNKSGSFTIEENDKTGKDFRSKGRLEYVGKHYLQFKGTKEYFLKAGPDAPETFLAYEEFDATYVANNGSPLKTFDVHIKDFNEGDPTWKEGKGKGIIGALNYLSSKGLNAFSFLTYNADGDGDNVWPFVKKGSKFHYDCSKLDQWGIVFEHAQSKGLYLHFKTQEQENDNNSRGGNYNKPTVPAALDGGKVGPERRVYYRELIARYGHNLALNWNLGEENTQTKEQQQEMAKCIKELDPYDHLIVMHTFPNRHDKYWPLLGDASELTGVSLQNEWYETHLKTLQWVDVSGKARKRWVVANDEQGHARYGVPPDPGYPGFDEDEIDYDLHDVRKQTLWGNIMAGGAGVEYYFGYRLPENDLVCEDYRSRDKSWDYCRIALEFFNNHEIPFWEMENQNGLIDNEEGSKEKYCFAKTGEIYLVYLGYAETSQIDLTDAEGDFTVHWFNPREGGKLRKGSIRKISGGSAVDLGEAPEDEEEDWLVVVQKAQ